MGGVDKSDQYIAYHRILRKTVRYWKTPFYHLLEVAATNAFIVHEWMKMEDGRKATTERIYRDQLVQQIIVTYGISQSNHSTTPDNFQICHGSEPSGLKYNRCVLCKERTTRRCPDCPHTPHLCQSLRNNCHNIWHTPSMEQTRTAWFRKKEHGSQQLQRPPLKRAGRPTGSKNKQKRRGRYRSL